MGSAGALPYYPFLGSTQNSEKNRALSQIRPA